MFDTLDEALEVKIGYVYLAQFIFYGNSKMEVLSALLTVLILLATLFALIIRQGLL